MKLAVPKSFVKFGQSSTQETQKNPGLTSDTSQTVQNSRASQKIIGVTTKNGFQNKKYI